MKRCWARSLASESGVKRIFGEQSLLAFGLFDGYHRNAIFKAYGTIAAYWVDMLANIYFLMAAAVQVTKMLPCLLV